MKHLIATYRIFLINDRHITGLRAEVAFSTKSSGSYLQYIHCILYADESCEGSHGRIYSTTDKNHSAWVGTKTEKCFVQLTKWENVTNNSYLRFWNPRGNMYWAKPRRLKSTFELSPGMVNATEFANFKGQPDWHWQVDEALVLPSYPLPVKYNSCLTSRNNSSTAPHI